MFPCSSISFMIKMALNKNNNSIIQCWVALKPCAYSQKQTKHAQTVITCTQIFKKGIFTISNLLDNNRKGSSQHMCSLINYVMLCSLVKRSWSHRWENIFRNDCHYKRLYSCRQMCKPPSIECESLRSRVFILASDTAKWVPFFAILNGLQ